MEIFEIFSKKAKFSENRFWKEINLALRSDNELDTCEGEANSSTVDDSSLIDSRVSSSVDII